MLDVPRPGEAAVQTAGPSASPPSCPWAVVPRGSRVPPWVPEGPGGARVLRAPWESVRRGPCTVSGGRTPGPTLGPP